MLQLTGNYECDGGGELICIEHPLSCIVSFNSQWLFELGIVTFILQMKKQWELVIYEAINCLGRGFQNVSLWLQIPLLSQLYHTACLSQFGLL